MSTWSYVETALAFVLVFLAGRYGNPRAKRAFARNPPTFLHRAFTVVALLLWLPSVITVEVLGGGRWLPLLLVSPTIILATWYAWHRAEPRSARTVARAS